jgi:hypothetical protein
MSGLTGLLVLAASIAATVYWWWSLIEIARIPGWQFAAAGSNKALWICVVLFLQIIGALLWLVIRRGGVVDAEDWPDPAAAADWYVDDEAGTLRWWDGWQWTDRYDTWSGTRPVQTITWRSPYRTT